MIKGAGHFLPENLVMNADLVKFINTTTEFIELRTGVLTRRHIDQDKGLKDLIIPAVQMALKNSGLLPSDIDLLIVNTLSPDHHDPSEACFIQPLLGLANIPAFDIRAQCSGFIYGMNIAQQFIANGTYKNVLVVCGEVLSKRMDASDEGRNLSVLLGDGAGAVIFSKSNDNGIVDLITKADGNYYKLLWTESPGTNNKTFTSDVCGHFRMNGKDMFNHAVKCLVEISREILENNHLSIDDIDLIIPHQPNMRILDEVANQLNIPEEKMIRNVNRFGNMASASLPVTASIAINEGIIQKGQKVLFIAYGSGSTWGACIYQF